MRNWTFAANGVACVVTALDHETQMDALIKAMATLNDIYSEVEAKEDLKIQKDAPKMYDYIDKNFK